MIGYHIDRTNSLHEGMTLSLNDNFLPMYDSERRMMELFPRGVSKHGERYLNQSESYLFPSMQLREMNESTMQNSNHIIEYSYELIRRLYFPDRLSRYQAIFCIPSLDDFVMWSEICQGLEGIRIFKIEFNETDCDILDSNLLQGGLYLTIDQNPTNFRQWFSPPLNYLNANRYWSGEHSDNPRLEILVKLPVQVGREVHID